METIGLCAAGLVLLPEVIYVQDIYSGDYLRANTMFKLTYQSYILFGMAMSYAIIKLLIFGRTKARKIFALIALVFLIMTTGYFGNSTQAWFGDWHNSENYKGLNAGEYLLNVNEEDYYATNWINENISGRPVMLEVNGDSYTDYCRVSVRTGLPTLLGWRTHEWLWQSEGNGKFPEILEKRGRDIETIYTGMEIRKNGDTTETTHKDASAVRQLIDEYNIEYIYVGKLEREKYQNPVQHDVLQSFGTVIYPADFEAADSVDTTYIIKINK